MDLKTSRQSPIRRHHENFPSRRHRIVTTAGRASINNAVLARQPGDRDSDASTATRRSRLHPRSDVSAQTKSTPTPQNRLNAPYR